MSDTDMTSQDGTTTAAQGDGGNVAPVRLVHWCWIPAQGQQGEYVLSRCEGTPLQVQQATVHVVWQYSRTRGAFWASEASTLNPPDNWSGYAVPGTLPRLDISLFDDDP